LRKGDRPTDGVFADNELQRTADNPHRRMHYEQVGLVIADRCSLLIAVMPSGEQPGKVGGTARIARFKRDGKFDEEAAAVAARSEEMAAPEPLDREAKGLVWVIDLGRDNCMKAEEALDALDKNNRYAWLTLERIDEFNRIVRASEVSLRAPMAHELFDASDG